MMDPLRLAEMLNPERDGEPYTVHRTAVVDAVNAGGTVDLNLSGVTVPRVPVLGGAGAWVGGTVSVLAWEGALLVLGAVTAGAPPGGFIPTGGFIPFGGTSLPPGGWLWCNGAAVSRTTYADLFAVIGTAYGAGNGSTTFNVPDLGGRVPVGYDSGDTDFNANGKTGGAKTHTLTVSQMPSHNHGGSTGSGGSGTTGGSGTLTTNSTSLDWRWYSSTGTGNRGATPGAGSANQESMPYSSHNHTIPSHSHSIPNHTHSISSQGGGAAHNNMQPYAVARYIIKA